MPGVKYAWVAHGSELGVIKLNSMILTPCSE